VGPSANATTAKHAVVSVCFKQELRLELGTATSSRVWSALDRVIAVQVVSAANIVGAGHGLEVGRKLELLSIRQAEAHAEQALRLQKRGQLVSQRATAQPASKLAAVAMQVHTLLLLLLLLVKSWSMFCLWSEMSTISCSPVKISCLWCFEDACLVLPLSRRLMLTLYSIEVREAWALAKQLWLVRVLSEPEMIWCLHRGCNTDPNQTVELVLVLWAVDAGI